MQSLGTNRTCDENSILVVDGNGDGWRRNGASDSSDSNEGEALVDKLQGAFGVSRVRAYSGNALGFPFSKM